MDFVPRLIACSTPLPCPSCKQLAVRATQMTANDTYHPGYHVKGHPLPTRERETLTLACSGCEFVVDLYTSSQRLKTAAEVLDDIGEFLAESNSGVPAADISRNGETR